MVGTHFLLFCINEKFKDKMSAQVILLLYRSKKQSTKQASIVQS
jgi:hypothetical protein